jgi:hypothetical protein
LISWRGASGRCAKGQDIESTSPPGSCLAGGSIASALNELGDGVGDAQLDAVGAPLAQLGHDGMLGTDVGVEPAPRLRADR